jgi:hypothetical protein
VKPQVTFGSIATEEGYDFLYVYKSFDAGCTSVGARLAVLDGQQAPGLSFESSTSHLCIYFTSDFAVPAAGFTATVSGGPPGCLPCAAGTYDDVSIASGCTACPSNAVSAVGSTALSSCECPAGYTVDARIGDDCVACEAGTYKDASGSATCTACPAGTFKPGNGPGACEPCEAGTYQAASDACECPTGYMGDAGVGGDCVACKAGTYKGVSGPARCQAPTGAKQRVWMDGSAGLFVGGPSEFLNPKP